MQVRLLVERGQDECIVKLAGTSYGFKRNEHGHLVAEITDLLSIAWVSDPRNSSFIPYNPPKTKTEIEVEILPATDPVLEDNVSDEVFDEVVPAFAEPVVEGGAVPTEKLPEGIEATPESGGAQDEVQGGER